MKRLIALTVAAFVSLTALCSTFRVERSINEKWTFTRDGEAGQETVNIPHTWNAADCLDEKPGFWRGTAFYRKNVAINDDLDAKRVYVKFEAAYQVLDLSVNDKYIGRHIGGFSAFTFDITDAVKKGENRFEIKLDNTHNPDMPPLHADFTFFGGIYRDVNLIIVPENHISVSHYASSGVYISTPKVEADKAEVKIETHLTIAREAKGLVLEHSILAPDGKQVAQVKSVKKGKLAGNDIVDIQKVSIASPALWDIDTPQMYSVVTTLRDSNGNVLDSGRNSFGIRTFRFDPEEGFFLNGRHVKLVGTNRHQDFKEMGNALPDEMHVRDVKLLKEMGGNFLRIAHYPQDPVVSQMCDKLGIVSTEEIPVIDLVTMTPEFTANCVQMAREMVYQSYNHPSRIVWAYMNEILNRRVWRIKGLNIDKQEYFTFLCDCAKQIDDAIREADPLRPTMLPAANAPELYVESKVTEYADIVGYNLYCGWYTLGLETFGPTLDKLHRLHPKQSLILTEYGADEDPRLHSFAPERFDYTCEYGLEFHKAHIPVILEKKYLAGSNVWNINDFHSEVRGFAVPHINNKGLTTLDRTPKDTYWLYKAYLSKEAFTRIGGQDWKIRGGQEKDGSCIQSVDVFSNGKEVSLCLNGKSLGKKAVVGRIATFQVPFSNGENVLTAKSDNGSEDLLRVDFRMVPQDLKDFTEMSVMMSGRYFEDRPCGQIWIPEQEYKPGSWGFVGGHPARPMSSIGSVPAYQKDILGSKIDPVFQTQRVDIQSFKADVPDGQYFIYLYFAEVARTGSGKALPYNFGNEVISNESADRVFDVAVCGTTVLKDFNIFAEAGSNYGVIKKFTVDVNDGKGICVDFTPVKGHTALNAIRIYRCQ